MTTPRDAIGLSERLRRGHNNSGLSPLDCKIALDELDALSARVKELEADFLAVSKWHSEAVAENDELQSSATRAEQERDEAYERAAKVAEGPIYEEKYRGEAGHNWFHIKQSGLGHAYGNGRLDAAAAIRRLAAGDEEGKP